MAEPLKGNGARPSDHQRAIIREVCEQSWQNVPSVGDTMRAKKVPFGDYMTYCQADLLAIVYNESRFNCGAVGDNGHSLGCFQVYAKAHPHITDEERLDFRWAAAWTVNRLIAYGWLPRTINGKSNRYAISKHNGTGDAAWNYALNAVYMSNLLIKEYSL